MAEYIYKDMKNEQGWGMTFNATGRLPIIGSRIFPTLKDLNEFINNANSTAIAGIQVSVIADGNNNGTYQIDFIDTTIIDVDGSIKCYNEKKGETNLKATKLVTVDNQGGVKSGNIIYGFYTKIEEKEVFVKRKGSGTNEDPYTYSYLNESGVEVSYTPQDENELSTLKPYIVLNMTNGDKVYIDAQAFQVDNYDCGTFALTDNNSGSTEQ